MGTALRAGEAAFFSHKMFSCPLRSVALRWHDVRCLVDFPNTPQGPYEHGSIQWSRRSTPFGPALRPTMNRCTFILILRRRISQPPSLGVLVI